MGGESKKKQETKQQREARKKKEKEKKEKEAAREKQVRDAAAAREEANKPAPATKPKLPAKKQNAAVESTEEFDKDVSSEEKEPGGGTGEEDEEEDGDLPVDDDRCGVSGCELGAGSGKNNCPRHQKAADEQKAAAKEDEPPKLRTRPSGDAAETQAGPPESKKPKKDHTHKKHKDRNLQKQISEMMAPFLSQISTLTQQLAAQVSAF